MKEYTRAVAALFGLCAMFAVQPVAAQIRDRGSDLETSVFVAAQLSAGLRETFSFQGDDFDIGDGTTLAIGAELGDDGPWLTRISIGYTFHSADTGPSDNEFSVFPIDLVFVHRLGASAEVGIGGSYYASPKYEADSPTESQEIEFDDQFGFLLEASYAPARLVRIGARYSYVTYSLSDTRFNFPDGSNDNELDGSALSVYAAITF